MPYVGQDFPPTSPNEERLYTFDFVNAIAILFTEVVTVGGTITAGDMVTATVQNPTLPGQQASVVYIVQASDTTSSIAAALAALISGLDVLNDAGITATSVGAEVTVSSPGQNLTVVSVSAAPATPGNAATETFLVAAGAPSGELITSATWSTAVYTGVPDSVSRILGSASISGSKVSTLAGGFLAGNVYRITCDAVTSLGQSIEYYSHVASAAPA